MSVLSCLLSQYHYNYCVKPKTMSMYIIHNMIKMNQAFSCLHFMFGSCMRKGAWGRGYLSLLTLLYIHTTRQIYTQLQPWASKLSRAALLFQIHKPQSCTYMHAHVCCPYTSTLQQRSVLAAFL